MKDKDVQTRLEEENSILEKFVSYLRSHLSKYEEVMSYDDHFVSYISLKLKSKRLMKSYFSIKF